jgi:hypothetical protein
MPADMPSGAAAAMLPRRLTTPTAWSALNPYCKRRWVPLVRLAISNGVVIASRINWSSVCRAFSADPVMASNETDQSSHCAAAPTADDPSRSATPATPSMIPVRPVARTEKPVSAACARSRPLMNEPTEAVRPISIVPIVATNYLI